MRSRTPRQVGSSLGLTLVTNDTSEFERVDGLTLENWLDEEEEPGRC